MRSWQKINAGKLEGKNENVQCIRKKCGIIQSRILRVENYEFLENLQKYMRWIPTWHRNTHDYIVRKRRRAAEEKIEI